MADLPDTDTRVMRYGVRWTAQSIALICGHLELTTRMYNDLAEHVNALLRVREDVIRAACPEYARLQDELSYVDRWRNSNFTAEQRKVIIARLRALLAAAVKPGREVYVEADRKFREAWPLVRSGVNHAYADLLCWTHRGLIDRAVEAAAKGQKTKATHQARTWGYRVRSREHDATGTLGGQTYAQEGVSTDEIWRWARGRRPIVEINSGTPLHLPEGRSARRAESQVPIRMRLETGVYLEGRLTIHRPLPTGMIKEIRLSRHLEGSRQQHHVLFTVTGIAKPLDAAGSGHEVAGLDAGWAEEDGALTAGALALPGNAFPIRPPSLDKLDWVDRLKGGRTIAGTARTRWQVLAPMRSLHAISITTGWCARCVVRG